MTFEEALGTAKKVETQTNNETTTALIVSGITSKHTAYKASDYNPLTTNVEGEEEVEAIQSYLDDSWTLLYRIMLIADDISKVQNGYLSTFDKGRLHAIADDIKMLRMKNMSLVA